MASTSRADTIRAIFAAYLSGDRKFVAEAFSEGFRFNCPFVKQPGRFAGMTKREPSISKIIFIDMSVP